jgi:hypothetical protein
LDELVASAALQEQLVAESVGSHGCSNATEAAGVVARLVELAKRLAAVEQSKPKSFQQAELSTLSTRLCEAEVRMLESIEGLSQGDKAALGDLLRRLARAEAAMLSSAMF